VQREEAYSRELPYDHVGLGLLIEEWRELLIIIRSEIQNPLLSQLQDFGEIILAE
jgi:hypothetical protein